jgi:predicted nucleotidyltransferase
MANSNLELLEIAAIKLKPLLSEIVFVGGCATGLLVTDPGAAPVRRTYDVDVIAEILSYADYLHFSVRLRKCGFSADASEGAPLCRWTHGELILDLLPLDETVLGFSNRWYQSALETAVNVQLKNGISLRAITAPYFIATKIAAFHGRGKKDYFASHDLEDLVTVIDGRSQLLAELGRCDSELRNYVAKSIQLLLTEPRFCDALPGFLLPDEANQARLDQIMERLIQLSRL